METQEEDAGMTDAERIEQLEYKVGEAYQVIGWLLHKCGLFETPEGQRALDYFAEEGAFDENFLPWPRIADDFPADEGKRPDELNASNDD